jgi:peptidoglycan hydrolase-like protein with peptidoglycan-binding domain
MKINKRVFILGMSLLVFLFCAYPVLAAQQEQSMQNSGMQQPGTQSGMQQNAPKGMQPEHSMQQKGMQPTSAQRGAPIFIGPAAVMQIQQKLVQEGQHKIKADGIWGHSTAQAVKNFQQSKGLVPTGNLNIATVQALGLMDIFSGTPPPQSVMAQSQKFAKTQGAHLYIGPSGLRQIQEKLSQEGQHGLKADGIWGPGTQQAIQKYQQDKGLKPTGNVDLALIEHLGLGQMVAALSQGAATGQQELMGQTGQAGQKEPQAYYGQKQGAQAGAMGKKQLMGTGAPLYADPETVRHIQKALADSGHNPGKVNGEWDRSTQQALKAYQKEQNLEPTGSLTISTVQKLMGGFELQKMDNEPSGSSNEPSGGSMKTPGSMGNEPSGGGMQSPDSQPNQQ